MNNRLDMLLAKMEEAMGSAILHRGNAFDVLRLALAELPLIRDAYERKIKALESLLRSQGGPDIPEKEQS